MTMDHGAMKRGKTGAGKSGGAGGDNADMSSDVTGAQLALTNLAVDTTAKIYELRQRQDNMLKAKAA